MDKNQISLPVLLIDDEQHTLTSFSAILKSSGIKEVITIQDSREVLPLLNKQSPAVVILDLFMPYITGNELLEQIKQSFPEIPVIVMTAGNDIENAIECMKAGAFDYLVKPVEMSRFISSVKRALQLCNLNNEIDAIRSSFFSDRLSHEDSFSAIITKSAKMLTIFRYIEAIAFSTQPVFITGETGTGKELIAKTFHAISGKTGRFIAVNTAGLDDAMFSDTLFGHKKGAFTGAEQQREGLIAQAANGTLFLDEIGDLSEASQIKLLRLLQDNIYYPLGSDVPKQTNASIVAATNRDIRHLRDMNKFRRDLYYRLSTHHIKLPPLREKKEDIPLLLNHFLGNAAKSMNKKKPTPPPELITLLSIYDFPGNVRELQTMVYDAVARHKSGVLSMESFREIIKKDVPASHIDMHFVGDILSGIFGHFPTQQELEAFHIAEALRLSNNNQSIAAMMLGITRQTLNRRLKIKSDK